MSYHPTNITSLAFYTKEENGTFQIKKQLEIASAIRRDYVIIAVMGTKTLFESLGGYMPAMERASRYMDMLKCTKVLVLGQPSKTAGKFVYELIRR